MRLGPRKRAEWVGGWLALIPQDHTELAEHFASIKWVLFLGPNPGKGCLHFGAFLVTTTVASGEWIQKLRPLSRIYGSERDRQDRRRTGRDFSMSSGNLGTLVGN